MQVNKTRETWIDIAKVFVMIMVVFTHINQTDFSLVTFVTVFHVPVFFILSGYLYKIPTDYKTNIKKLIKTLVVPYLLLNIIPIAYQIVFYPKDETFSIYKFVWLPIRQVILGETGLPLAGPMWFVYTLFVLRIIIDSICFKIKEKKSQTLTIYSLAIVSSIVAYFICTIVKHGSVYSAIIAPMSIPFFVIGYALKQYNIISSLTKKKTHSIFIACIFAALTYVAFTYNNGSNMSILDYGENYLLFYLGSICGSLMIILFSSLVKVKREDYFKNTCIGMLVILAWHYPLWCLITQRAMHIYQFEPIPALICATALVISMYPIIQFVKKYCPILIGNRK